MLRAVEAMALPVAEAELACEPGACAETLSDAEPSNRRHSLAKASENLLNPCGEALLNLTWPSVVFSDGILIPRQNGVRPACPGLRRDSVMLQLKLEPVRRAEYLSMHLFHHRVTGSLSLPPPWTTKMMIHMVVLYWRNRSR